MDETTGTGRSGTGSDSGVEVARADLVRQINELVPGTLTMHLAERDLVFDLAGADAIRIMTAHRRGRADDLADDLDPDSSSMLSGWIGVALGKVLAMSWVPGPDAAKVVLAGLRADQDAQSEPDGTAGHRIDDSEEADSAAADG